MTDIIDFEAPARALERAADGVDESQFGAATPCDGRTVGELLGHIVSLTAAFRACAEKDLGPRTDTNPDQSGWPEPENGWRNTLADRLPALVEAWRTPDAWDGLTRAGGQDLPGEVAGLVALDEIVLHGWDLSRATGQEYSCDEATAQALLDFVSHFDPAGTPGLFGPALSADPDAPVFDQVLARAGRDPHWSPS